MSDLDAAIREWLSPVPTVDEWGPWMHRTRAALIAVLDVSKPGDKDGYDRCECLSCCHDRVLAAIGGALGIESADAPH